MSSFLIEIAILLFSFSACSLAIIEHMNDKIKRRSVIKENNKNFASLCMRNVFENCKNARFENVYNRKDETFNVITFEDCEIVIINRNNRIFVSIDDCEFSNSMNLEFFSLTSDDLLIFINILKRFVIYSRAFQLTKKDKVDVDKVDVDKVDVDDSILLCILDEADSDYSAKALRAYFQLQAYPFNFDVLTSRIGKFEICNSSFFKIYNESETFHKVCFDFDADKGESEREMKHLYIWNFVRRSYMNENICEHELVSDFSNNEIASYFSEDQIA